MKFNDKHFNIQNGLDENENSLNGLDENENSLNGLVILQDITIQKICNVNFKKWSLQSDNSFILTLDINKINTPFHHNNLIKKIHR